MLLTLLFGVFFFVIQSLAQQDFLLVGVTQSASDGIYNYTPATGSWQKLPLPNVVNPVAISYDPVDNRVYWSDGGNNSIVTAKSDGSGFRSLKTYAGQVDGLVVEPSSRLLYYTDLGGGKVIARHLVSGEEAVIVENDVGAPRDIVVDYARRWVYWSDWGGEPKVERARTDGSGRETVFKESTLDFTNGLHLDATTETLYVCDVQGSTGSTVYVSVNAATKAVLQRQVSSNSHCYHLEGNSSTLYIADWKKGLQAAPLSQASQGLAVAGQPSHSRIMGIAYHRGSWSRLGDPCSNGGGCGSNQLCLPSQSGSICRCTSGYTGPNCNNPENNAYLPAVVVASSSETTLIVGNPADWLRTSKAQRLVTLSGHGYGRMAVDINNEIIYFYNTNTNSIDKYDLPSQGNSLPRTALLSSVVNVRGLELDSVRRTLLFSVSSNGTAGVSSAILSLDIQSRVAAPVVTAGVTNPGGLAVDSYNGLVYWVDSTQGTVERASVGGGDRRTLASGLVGASDIAADFSLGKLYVVANYSLYSLDICGGSPNVLFTRNAIDTFIAVDLHQAYILVGARTLFGDRVYMVDRSDFSVAGNVARPGVLQDAVAAFPTTAPPVTLTCFSSTTSTTSTTTRPTSATTSPTTSTTTSTTTSGTTSTTTRPTSRTTSTTTRPTSRTTSTTTRTTSRATTSLPNTSSPKVHAVVDTTHATAEPWAGAAVIAGIVTGGVVLVGILTAVTVTLVCMRKKQSHSRSRSTPEVHANMKTVEVSIIPSSYNSNAPEAQDTSARASYTSFQDQDQWEYETTWDDTTSYERLDFNTRDSNRSNF